jgi:hypothetical protein
MLAPYDEYDDMDSRRRHVPLQARELGCVYLKGYHVTLWPPGKLDHSKRRCDANALCFDA